MSEPADQRIRADAPILKHDDENLKEQLRALQLELIDALAEGGTSRVYKVHNATLDRIEALKIIDIHQLSNPKSLKRMQREAQAVSRLDHPNIVRVHSMNVLPNTQPFLSMEYLQGESLRSYLDRERKLSTAQVQILFPPLLRALECAHAAGIIHRDIKPSNIFLVEGDLKRPKLIDFGIAKTNEFDGSQRLTQTGQLVGSPKYMSPEQCRSEQLDTTSDIYSLACVMFECLYGRAPYESDNELEIMYKHANEETPSLPHNAGVPPHIESLLLACLCKNPAERAASAADVLSALESLTPLPHRMQRRHAARQPAPQGLMRWLGVLATGIIAALALLSVLPKPPAEDGLDLYQENPQILLNKATGERNEGDYAEAEKLFKSAVQLTAKPGEGGNHNRAFLGLGLTYRVWGKPTQAIDTFLRGLKEMSEHAHDDQVRFRREIADIYFSQQQIDQARKYYAAAREALNNWHPAAHASERIDKLEEAGWVYYNWGVLEDTQNNLPAAAELLEEALKTFAAQPPDVTSRETTINARYRLASVNQRRGQFQEALALYNDIAFLAGNKEIKWNEHESKMLENSKKLAAECSQQLVRRRN